jgi:3-oxoacyl-[acyl-carrier-protein] synthase III
MPATILATAYHLPEKVFTNADFFREFPDSAGKSLEKTGVAARALTQEHEVASDLAFAAAEKLLADSPVPRSEIDLLVYCSVDTDYYTPSTACVLQGRLGLPASCGAFDIVLGCSGYVYSLSVINGLLATTGARNALLLNAATLTKFIHPGDRANRFIFGDAGSATLIAASGNGSIGPSVFGTDGSRFEKIIVRDGFRRHPYSEASYLDEKDEYGNVTNPASFYMDGTGVFLFTLRVVPPMISELLEKAQLGIADVDLFIFHQPNVFLNETLRKKIGIPEEKFVHCMERFGNTVSATIPIAITESVSNGRLKRGMTVVLAGFGVGLSWAATVVKY